MSRKYRHIREYETEIISMYNQGLTLREIGNRLGFTHQQMRDFKTRYNKKQRMVEAGKALRKKGRPRKNGDIPPSIEKLDKLAQMRYVMEVELMRDFLSLTGRK